MKLSEEPRKSRRPVRFCGYCGGKLNPAHGFCTFCGEPVEGASPLTPADPKVTPISPDARKVIQEFENEMAALRMKRRRPGKFSGAVSKEPNMKLLIAGGILFFAFLIAFFHFMLRYMTNLAAGGRP